LDSDKRCTKAEKHPITLVVPYLQYVYYAAHSMKFALKKQDDYISQYVPYNQSTLCPPMTYCQLD